MVTKEKHVKTKKKNEVFPKVIFILSCAAFGGIIGVISISYFKNFIKSGNGFMELTKIYGLFFIAIIGYMIHIIIHEAGHLVFGLMTGYSFVSFRIGSLTLIKEDGKFRVKRFNIPGTAGQCLMMPPELKEDKFPFIIYNFGGVIMNLIVSLSGILAAVFIEGIKFPLDAVLILTGMGGLFAALTNGIPMKVGGIANDAYNVKSMLKDEEARRGFYVQLRVNGLQSFGIRIKDMPLNMFKLNENSDMSNPLNTALKLLEYSWYLDNMDLENARKIIDSLVPHLDNIIPLYKNEINCERIFLELVGDCNKELIDELYDKALKRYIKAAKFMISKKRLLMAYEGFYNKDSDMLLRYYEDIKRMTDKYPIKGDAEMELMLAGWIKERFASVSS